MDDKKLDQPQSIDQLEMSAAEKRAILKARAQALARVASAPDNAEALAVVEFIVAGETYAIESAAVREIYPLKELISVPCTPAFVLGIINLRGQILSVIDLRRFFALPGSSGLNNLTKVIIVRGAELEVGILADAVLSEDRLLESALHQPLPTITGIQTEYLKAITANRVLLLDIYRILADERLIVREEVE